MVEDWSVNYKPDLLTFVPYEWNFNIVLRDFEVVWLGNQHNWIECTSNRHENGTSSSLLGSKSTFKIFDYHKGIIAATLTFKK